MSTLSSVNITSAPVTDQVSHYVVFCLDDQRYALPLPSVEKVVHMVDITPLMDAPQIIVGVINMQGRVLPVFNIRRRFQLTERDIAMDDQLVIAHAAHRTVALVVDAVDGLVQCPEQDLLVTGDILPSLEHVEGIIKLQDGLILIHCLDAFLSGPEEKSLDMALQTS
ncbi:CheW protein [Candidatus Methylobacter favarea]|uniref:CheW protein n=1 Tax=Candidatus Methylobacter favarea TaxID=2707345 RepID=A0A8S0WAL6_9GAMM|nr:CheW protein [Candidatus Methylobacter favarea]